MVNLGNDWDEILKEEFNKEYYLSLREFLKAEYSTRRIYPPMFDIYNALRYTSYEHTRVVILGQDPYHGYGQAHGLCFSVKEGTPPPPSLKNIFKELKEELGIEEPPTGELIGWAKQGVLLLNTTLTVRESSPQSHKGKGWEILTDRIIEIINEKDVTFLFVTHSSSTAKSFCKRGLVMRQGKLMYDSDIDDAINYYKNMLEEDAALKKGKSKGIFEQ